METQCQSNSSSVTRPCWNRPWPPPSARLLEPFAESPSPRHYGETANDDGRAAFEALRGKPFPLDLPGAEGSVGGEASPYGFDLGITYPRVPAAKLVAASSKALEQWRRAGRAPGSACRWKSCRA